MGKEYSLRLKDIENVGSENPDINIIASEVVGTKPSILFFKRGNRKMEAKIIAHKLISDARLVNPKSIELPDECLINKPNTIDNISFRAMMELKSYFGTYIEGSDFGEFMAHIISIVCYQENCSGDYNSNSIKFDNLKFKILNSPIWEMIGIYNWVEKSIIETSEEWNNRFLSVEIEDKDYEQAGGNRMAQFNVMNTIKTLCSDFNCSYDQAWQMSYALTQTNSYAKATQSHIQDNMRIIKESKMKTNRANK